jgi:3D (Asp-Asp-Asp) domain-containing protein
MRREEVRMNSNKFSLCRLLLLLPLILACTPIAPTANAGHTTGEPTPPKMIKVGDLKPTFYWVALEEADGQPRDKPLRNVAGEEIARVSAKFLAGLRMEGTGKFLDGRVINFHARVDGEIRWRWCPPEAPYGYGLEDYVLKPFRSVAVDPKVVPIPSRVYIPAALNMPLPDGTLHDGIFEAIDIGAAIQDKRIDMFTSYGDQSVWFRRHGITNMKPIEVFLISE